MVCLAEVFGEVPGWLEELLYGWTLCEWGIILKNGYPKTAKRG